MVSRTGSQFNLCGTVALWECPTHCLPDALWGSETRTCLPVARSGLEDLPLTACLWHGKSPQPTLRGTAWSGSKRWCHTGSEAVSCSTSQEMCSTVFSHAASGTALAPSPTLLGALQGPLGSPRAPSRRSLPGQEKTVLNICPWPGPVAVAVREATP